MQINPRLNTLDFTDQLISLDLETTGLQGWADSITLIAISTTDENYLIYPENYDYADLQAFTRSLQFCRKIIGHNFKFDLGFIFSTFGVLYRNAHCTMVAQQIIDNGRQSLLDFDLVSVLERSIHITHQFAEEKKQLQKSFGNEEIRYVTSLIPGFKEKQELYAVEDTKHLIQVYHKQIAQITELELLKVYKLEHTVMPVIVKMEQTGVPINKELWSEKITKYWEPEQIRIEKLLDKEVDRLTEGYKWKYSTSRNRTQSIALDLFSAPCITEIESDNSLNYGSTDHVISLFKLLGETPPVDKKGDPSVGEGALTVYLTEHPETKLGDFINILLEYRKITKLLSTYGHSFLAQLDQDGNIHTQYTQTSTETGRLSSKSPNLQNIPAPDSSAPEKDIRECFIAPPCYKFITSDMSGAEVAIAADLSREPLLVDAYLHDADMHSQFATTSYSIIFNEPTIISKSKTPITVQGIQYIPSELRDNHKSVVFAKFYKGGPKRIYGVLSKYINKHCKPKQRQKVSKEISDKFDEQVPLLSAYLTNRINEAKRTGSLRAPVFGRIRWFANTAFGDAANYYLQCLNAEAIKVAMINMDKYLTERQIGHLVLTVHDELAAVVKDEYAELSALKLKEIMESALSYFLEIIIGKATVKINTHWSK